MNRNIKSVDTAVVTSDEGDMWLFGYGSLIWKPPPFYDVRIAGYVEGYVRRFWQASEDHRGTCEAPGLVVTLLEYNYWKSLNDHYHESSGSKVWGMAYHFAADKVKMAREYLDLREINGYSIRYTTFHATGLLEWAKGVTKNTDTTVVLEQSKGVIPKCMVYIGLPTNAQFRGLMEPKVVVNQIMKSQGPSGKNVDYLLSLHRALLELGGEDDVHVRDLVKIYKLQNYQE